MVLFLLLIVHETTDTEVELTVQDTGIGIPQDELENLGKRFHRISFTRGRTHEGTGIGTPPLCATRLTR